MSYYAKSKESKGTFTKIAQRKDTTPKEGKDKYGDVAFADEKNKKYPIDTSEHIHAAWNYINKEENASKYSSEDVTKIKNKIIAAWKDKIDKTGPPSAEKKAAGDSLDDQLNDIRQAFGQLYGNYGSFPQPVSSGWVMEVYADYVIACFDDDYFKVGYSVDPADEEAITFADRTEWQAVEKDWVVSEGKSVKIGARHSSKDMADMQTIHDIATKQGASCDPDNAKFVSLASMPLDDVVVSYGDEIKAVKLEDGSVKLGGYLVRFADDKNMDLTTEFFAGDTDYGDASKSDVWFNHRLPVRTKDGDQVEYKSRLGKADLKRDDVGYFAEVILKARNEYEQMIIDAGLAGKLGWSSGTAGHLMDKEPSGKGMKITQWPLGLDASLTPTPAEARKSNMVVSLKSISVINSQASGKPSGQAKPEGSVKSASETNNGQQNVDHKGDDKMELTQEELQKIIDGAVEKASAKSAEVAKTAADEAVKAYVEKTEGVTGSGVKVTKDEADQPWGKGMEANKAFFLAVKNAALNPSQPDPRLLAMKAPAGLSEGVSSDGGFLLLPQMAAGIMERMYTLGQVLSRVSKDPLGPNSNTMLYNGIDETSRVDGSRWGGLLGYWLAEAGALTGTKPKFFQVPLKLKKVGALAYATDEQLQDTTALASWLTRTVPMELTFQVEYAVINGVGGGMPLGIMNSAPLVSVTRLDASKIQIQDISNMLARVWMGSQVGTLAGGLCWFADQSTIPQLAQLVIGNYPAFIPMSQGLTGALPATLMGRPVVFTEYNAALGTVGDILLCDMSQYQMIEKGGVQQASSIHVNFLTDEQVFRFIYRVDGAPLWKGPLTPRNGGATLSPFVALTTAT